MNSYIRYNKYFYKNNILTGGNNNIPLFDIGIEKIDTTTNLFSGLFRYIFEKKSDDNTDKYLQKIENTLKNKRCIYVIDFANVVGIMKIEENEKATNIQKTIFNFVKMKIEAGHLIIIVHKPIQNLNIKMLFNEQNFVKNLESYVNKRLFIIVINFNFSEDVKFVTNAVDDILYWLLCISLFAFAYRLNTIYIHQLYFMSNDKQKINKEAKYYQDIDFKKVSFHNIQGNVDLIEDFRNDEDKFLKVYMEKFFKLFGNSVMNENINEYEIRNKYNRKNEFSQIISDNIDLSKKELAKLFYTYVYYIQAYIFGKDNSFKQENLLKIIRFPNYKYPNNNYTEITPVTELKNLLVEIDEKNEQLKTLEEKIRNYEAKINSERDSVSSDSV